MMFSTNLQAETPPSARSEATQSVDVRWDMRRYIAKLSWPTEDFSATSWPRQAYRVQYKRQQDGEMVLNQQTVGRPEVELRELVPNSEYLVTICQLAAGAEPQQIIKSRLHTPEAPEAPKGEVTELSRLEIRVGKIVELGRHPDADSLYVEKVDIGEAEPRTIVSGLVKYQSEDQLLKRDVIVLANLKPRAMRGVTSHGMLLCASNEDHSVVEPLTPPDGTPIGELITFEGHAAQLEPPGNRATKAFDKIKDNLIANEDKVATFKGTPFMTSKGPVTTGIQGTIS